MNILKFNWEKKFDAASERMYVDSLSTSIGEKGARKLVEVARIYEKHDWFRLLLTKVDSQIAGEIAFYYEPIHGSHEAWMCTNPNFTELEVGEKMVDEFERNALNHGIRIFRADASLPAVRNCFCRKGYQTARNLPHGFSLAPEDRIVVWKIMDFGLPPHEEPQEKRNALEWECSNWKW